MYTPPRFTSLRFLRCWNLGIEIRGNALQALLFFAHCSTVLRNLDFYPLTVEAL
jgi:hypothetical protein